MARTRAGPGPIQWAVAEAKGTKKSLGPTTSCEPWQEQVHNVQISMDGSFLIPQRHIVVATHLNPGAFVNYRTSRVVPMISTVLPPRFSDFFRPRTADQDYKEDLYLIPLLIINPRFQGDPIDLLRLEQT